MIGGEGNDWLYGEAGKDTYVLGGKNGGVDTIGEFQLGEDKISVKGSSSPQAKVENDPRYPGRKVLMIFNDQEEPVGYISILKKESSQVDLEKIEESELNEIIASILGTA